MIFFKGMNSVMKQKIHEHFIFSNLWEGLITLVKKLCLSVDMKLLSESQTLVSLRTLTQASSSERNENLLWALLIKLLSMTLHKRSLRVTVTIAESIITESETVLRKSLTFSLRNCNLSVISLIVTELWI